jgi:hypothetical protein
MGGGEECIKEYDGKARKKRSPGRPRHMWVDLRERVWFDMDWIDLVQDQWRVLVSTEMNLRGQYNVGKFWSS